MLKTLPAHEQFIGTAIEGDGDFRFVEYIGRGSYALVLKGYSETLRQSAAYKVIPCENLAPGDSWQLEPQKANSLRNSAVVHCHAHLDWRKDKGLIVLKYDYVDGCTLRDFIKQHKNQITVPFIKYFLEVMLDLFFELQKRGIEHGDFHSRNIWLQSHPSFNESPPNNFELLISARGASPAAPN